MARSPGRKPVAVAMTDRSRREIGTRRRRSLTATLIWLSSRTPMIAISTTGPMVAQVADFELATPFNVSIDCWISRT